MKFLLAIVTTIAVLAGFSGIARAEAINCPLSQTTKTITDPLPAGWWTTPFVNTLSETRIQNIGGHPALLCVYGSNGSIQREVPANKTCTARVGGFDCVANLHLIPGLIPGIITPVTPGTYRSGLLSVPQTYMFDLDAGAVGTGSGTDLWFEADTTDLLYITPSNGAKMWTGDRSNRNYAGCAAGTHYTPDRISLSDLPVGSYVCVKTNEGRVSQFRVNGIVPTSATTKTLNIGYTTWNN